MNGINASEINFRSVSSLHYYYYSHISYIKIKLRLWAFEFCVRKLFTEKNGEVEYGTTVNYSNS